MLIFAQNAYSQDWGKQEAWTNETTDLTTYVLPSSSLGIGMPVTLLTAAAALVCISCTTLAETKFSD